MSYLYHTSQLQPVDALNQMQMFSGYYQNFSNMIGGHGVGVGGMGSSSKNALLRNQLNNPIGSFSANSIMGQGSQQQQQQQQQQLQQQLSPLNLHRNLQQPLTSPTNMMSGGGIVGALRMSPIFPYSNNSSIHNPLPSRVTNSLPSTSQSRYSPSISAARTSSNKTTSQVGKVASSTHKTLSNRIIQRRKSRTIAATVAEALASIQPPRTSQLSKSNLVSLSSVQIPRASQLPKSNIDTLSSTQSARTSHLSKLNPETLSPIETPRASQLPKSNIDTLSSTQSARTSHLSKSNVRPNSSVNLSILPDNPIANQQSIQTLRANQISKSNVRSNSSINLSILPDNPIANQQSNQTPRANQISKSNVQSNSSVNLSKLQDNPIANQQSNQTHRSSQFSISNIRSIPPDNLITGQQSSSVNIKIAKPTVNKSPIINPKLNPMESASTIKSTTTVLQTKPSKPLPTTSNGKSIMPPQVPLKTQETAPSKASPLISIKSPSSINKDASSVVHKPLNKTPMIEPSPTRSFQNANFVKSNPIIKANFVQRQLVMKKSPNKTQALAPGPSGLNLKPSSSVPPKPSSLEKPNMQIKKLFKSPMMIQQKDQNVQQVLHQPSSAAKKTLHSTALKTVSLSASQIQNLKMNIERTTLVNRSKEIVKIAPKNAIKSNCVAQAQAVGSRSFQRTPLILSNSRNNQMKMANASAVTISKIPSQSQSRAIGSSQRAADNTAGPATVTRIVPSTIKRVLEVSIRTICHFLGSEDKLIFFFHFSP